MLDFVRGGSADDIFTLSENFFHRAGKYNHHQCQNAEKKPSGHL